MNERVNSYDPNARLPKVGTRWVWEIDKPHACTLIEVEEVLWNGEEWWVRCAALYDPMPAPIGAPVERGKSALNDVGRFWEAVTPVGGKLIGRHDLWERRPGEGRDQGDGDGGRDDG